jgi:hypothetical protein
MAKKLGHRNDRAVRVAIQALIEKGHTIAASVHQPMGFYLLETPEEAAIYKATLRSRALKTLKRLSDFRRARMQRFGPAEQLALFTLEAAIKELERR